MILSDISIRRPVLATVMTLLIVLVGIIAYDRLSVREYPNIDVPVVTVATTYFGANAAIMESQVTKILEDSLSGIEGIDFMTSVSRSESSQITINFKLTRDADSAANDVRDRVARVRGQLPDAIEEPIVSKEEADAQPIIYMAFSSDRHNMLEVTDVANRLVKDRVQTIDGVANVRIFGERRYSMRIWLDRARMAAYHVTAQDVEAALRSQNLEVPSGRIESSQREFSVLAETDLRTPEQFRQVILRDDSGYLVRLGDVARVEVAPAEERRITRFKGENAVALGVIKQSTANPLDISTALHEMLPTIKSVLPEGMKVNIAYDKSVFIDRSIESVYTTIAEAVILVILVIFGFLRSARATLIPMVTIPVSLIGAFFFMYLLGFSINILTLLAMVLAIGLVVDDAIVMLENIYRHIENGEEPIQAALKGAKEIGFAVLAMTFTLAAVFTPVAFTEGATGRLFAEFALTLAGAVIVSGFIALTLSPMLCSRMLKHEKHGALYEMGERFLTALNEKYEQLLRRALEQRKLVIGAALLVVLAMAGLFTLLKSELAPIEDRGLVMGIGIGPDGATPANIDKSARQMEAMYKSIPEVERYFMVVGVPTVNQIISFVGLKDWSERKRSATDIANELRPKLFMGIPGVMAFAVQPPSLGQSVISRPLEFYIQTTGTYDELQQTTNKIMAKVRENPGLLNPDTDLKLNKPELRVQVNREKSALVGVEVSTINRTLESMLGGRTVTRYKRAGEQFDVIVQVEDVDRRDPQDLTNIQVRSGSGEMMQLGNLVSMRETVAPQALNHFNKLRAVKITSTPAPGYSLGEAIAFMQKTLDEVAPDALFDYGGQSREFIESSSALFVTGLLALGFIYLVLAAQFESFRSPLIILLSVPLAMTGALLTLKLTGGTLNIYSKVGLITLIGLITKHGILIVEFANQMRDKGHELQQAVVEAAVLRLRPILMTTGAMVLGSIPLALASGAGAESRQQIGWVIVGGMSLGTLMTLFVVPVVYTYIAGKRPDVS
jgi:multidrug efflux pump